MLSWVIDIKTWTYNLLRNGKYLNSSQLRISSDYLAQTLSSVLKPACVKYLLAPIFDNTNPSCANWKEGEHQPKSLEALFFLHFTILSFVFSVVLSVTGAHTCPIDNPHPGKWEGRKARYRPPVCGSPNPAPCQSVCCSCDHSTTIQSATCTFLWHFL